MSDLYNNLKDKFNERLTDFFRPLEKVINENLFDAMKYSIFNTGKRLRPVLCMLGARFAGGVEDDIMTFALALEMIHTYSLIHDDLPSIDNDSLRRGKLTTHVMHGEGIAVLAGDALLNLAYEIMTEETLKTGNFRRLRAMNLIMKCAGCKGMLNGQAKDIDYERSGSFLFEHILNMYRNKTSDLIRAALVSGAMIKGAHKDELKSLSLFADSFGVYFQIQDDLLDEAQASPVNKKKANFVKAVGAEESQRALIQYEKFIREALEPFGARAAEILELFENMKNREN